MEQLTLWSEEALASLSQSPETEVVWRELVASCSSTSELFTKSCQYGFSGRTSQVLFHPREAVHSRNCSMKWQSSGMSSRGEFLTRNSSEWPSDAGVSFLSDILEAEVPSKYYLSPMTCDGIIRRAYQSGRGLPESLERALTQQAASMRSESAVGSLGGKGPLIQKDVSGTLVNHQEQAIFEPDGNSYIVRRFTPLECERLQGLPDGWTDIHFNGRRATDAERYKAIGNSFSVPVVAWIGSRIDRCERLGADALWS